MLSPRLQAIADLVMPCRRLIDVGTDHAYLPIELVRQGRCDEALALDLREKPLRQANIHIDAAGLSDRVRTQLCYGLDGLALRDDDLIVIAGLGGLEMIDILERADLTTQRLILQPMKSAWQLRDWLTRHGFVFADETLVCERGYIYPLMVLRPRGKPCQLSLIEAWLGPLLMHRQPEHYPEYVRRRLRQLEKHSRGQNQLQPLLEPLARHLASLNSDLSAAAIANGEEQHESNDNCPEHS